MLHIFLILIDKEHYDVMHHNQMIVIRDHHHVPVILSNFKLLSNTHTHTQCWLKSLKQTNKQQHQH